MKLNKYEKFFGDSAEKEKNIEDWDDFDFVLSKVKQNGLALKYASNFQDNEEIVKLAVQENGYALQFASNFQDNEEIVKEAVKQYGYALAYASKNLQKEFIKKQPELIKYVNQTPELVKTAIDNGLKDKILIKISKEELFEYINSLNKKSIKP